jgi:PHD/YefM family antitoxin component YafN of YafNO toxin-antitoxin module
VYHQPNSAKKWGVTKTPLSQPVIVTRNGRDRTVMISAEEYQRLKKRDREVLRIEDFTDAEIEAVRLTEPSKEAEAFNREFNL